MNPQEVLISTMRTTSRSLSALSMEGKQSGVMIRLACIAVIVASLAHTVGVVWGIHKVTSAEREWDKAINRINRIVR